MEVVLFDGTRPTMTANLKLQSGDTFALTGQQSSEGTLLLRISPTTAAQGIHRSEISLTAPRHLPPATMPAKAIANATTPMMQSNVINCAMPCAVVC